jgi:uncharacterized protein (UPF0332 family)
MKDADTIALVSHTFGKADDAIIQADALLVIDQHFGAVNRAYYAVFYAALAILLTKGLGSSKHSGVLALFDREFVKTQEVDKKWSKMYHMLFELRAAGDYAKLTAVSKAQADRALQEAKEFVAWAKQWLREREWVEK